MFATALIVFREMLEAALIVGIVMAVTRGASRRGLWVTAGIGGGLAGAALVAAFADVIANAVAGAGQELFNASVLFLAVFMLGWHSVWMKQHSRELVAEIKAIGSAVVSGTRPLHVLAVVIGIAVLREGSEVVLFLWGIAASPEADKGAMLNGGLLGLVAGAFVGMVIYLGLLRIPTRHLFSVTTVLILLLAAGLAAQGAGYLVQAGLLPPLGTSIWDTSHILSERSTVGQLLHILVGYIARPDGIQVLFYVATLALITGLMKWSSLRHAGLTEPRGMAAAFLVLTATAVLGLAPAPGEASQKVYSPRIEKGELELEFRGHVDRDASDELDGGRKDKYEIGLGVTDWWFSSVFVEFEKTPGGDLHHEASAWENIFQLTEPGKHWLDAGLYLEYEMPVDGGHPDKLEAKLLLERTSGRLVHTANLVLAREVGGGASSDVELEYAWRTGYRYRQEFEPGFEVYGTAGTLDDLRVDGGQEAQAGPVVRGKLRPGGRSGLRYELGYLLGLNSATPDGSLKWLLEYEYVY
ncbi:MAG: FTR1 family protein [Gammaproteobacteria bacterium]|nr:FTR1 family protein [Gammaproteobacteria bacterium]